jgi:peptidoglycan/LPS O-acetylase OafA/YrhL
VNTTGNPGLASRAHTSRDPNLDLLRAAAISAVLVFHAAQFWTVQNVVVNKLAMLGQFGVDLFFVLSGWLIGGLYWRERRQTGHVDLRRFWYRRWLRTLPPYYAGLALAYAAVWIWRREPFDWGYLVFVQNYYPRMPFFVPSWSLCVEEQFYLLLPLLLLVAIRLHALPVLLVAAVLGPIILRYVVASGAPAQFMSNQTHLRCDGLALGVFCSFLSTTRPVLWLTVRRAARMLAVPASAAFVSMAFWPRQWWFPYGLTLVTATCTLVLAAVAGARPLPLAASRGVHRIAIWSYSIYLSHNLVLLAGSRATPRLGELPAVAHVALWIAASLGVAWAFFRLIELPAIQLRDRWAPRGAADPQSPPDGPGGPV